MSGIQQVLIKDNGVFIQGVGNGLGLGNEKIAIYDTTTDPFTLQYEIDPLNLTAVAPNQTPLYLNIVDTLSIASAEVNPDYTASIQTRQAGVGSIFGLDYFSTTNEDFLIQSSSSGSIKYIQTGVGATTKNMTLNPTEIIMNDTSTTSKTATLTNDHLYIQSSQSNTSPTHTEITDVSIISNTHDNILGGDSTTTIQGASMLMLNTQPNLSTSQQLQITPDNVILTTNGGVPSTASWASILAGGGATPTISAVLTQGNDATGLGLFNVGSVQFTDAQTTLSSASIAFANNNGAITGLQTINGSPYPPSSSQNLNTTLSYGNQTSGFNIDFTSNSDIQNCVNGSITNITCSTINGSSYPPYPTSPYGLPNVLAIDNNANGANITGVNNIDVSTINGGSYPPSPYYPDLNSVLTQGNSAYHDIDMTGNQIVNCANINTTNINGSPYNAKASYTFPTYGAGTIYSGSYTYGGSAILLPAGTYQITYTIAWDGTMVSGGVDYCNCYCYLHSSSYGDYYTTMKNNGFASSFQITTQPSYPNYLTFCDNIYLPNSDTYNLGTGQSSSGGQYGGCFISATLVLL